MKKKNKNRVILVSVTNDLVTDQRVHKVCTTLVAMGFKIHLIGRKLKNSLALERDYKTTRLRLLFNKGPLFYAEYNFRLFWFLLFAKKSVLLANDLDTLLPNFLVSKITHKPLVYDSHELFTEVPELINRPKTQKIWLRIEQFVFPKLKYVFTVSKSIVEYYSDKYNVDVKLLRNVPVKLEADIVLSEQILEQIRDKKALIYQGAINVGRGVFLMIDVMKHVENSVLYIVGDGDVYEDVKEKICLEKLEHKVKLLGRITPEELKKITPCFHLGLSFEENLGMSYTYALPNKIFDYIQAEIPVLASNLPEMSALVTGCKVGQVLVSRQPKNIAKQISEILSTDYTASLKISKQKLHWDKEAEVMNQIYHQFLK